MVFFFIIIFYPFLTFSASPHCCYTPLLSFYIISPLFFSFCLFLCTVPPPLHLVTLSFYPSPISHLLLFLFECQLVFQSFHQVLHGGGWGAGVGLFLVLQFILYNVQLLVSLRQLFSQLIQLSLEALYLMGMLPNLTVTHKYQ